MRDFSKVSPGLWRSKKFRSLKNADARMIYLYLLTCPHGNSAGCFDMLEGYACADMQMVSQQYGDGIAALSEVGLIECDAAENTFLITNWMEFNEPSNPKHAIGILTQLLQASSETLKIKRFQEISAIIAAKKFDRDLPVRTVLALFANGIETVSPPRPETETRPRGRPDQTRPDLDLREKAQTADSPPATLTGGGPSPLGKPDPVALYAELEAEARSQPPPIASVHPLMQTRLMKQAAG